MKKFFGLIMGLLGITAFAVNAEGKQYLTDEQKAKLKESFGEDFIAQLEPALNTEATEQNPTPLGSEALASSLSTITERLVALEQERATLAADKTALEADKSANANQIKNLTTMIAQLSQKDETDPNPKKGAETQSFDVMNDKFLFGIEKPFMAIDASRPYNLRAYASLAAKAGHRIMIPEAASMDYSQLKTDLGDYYRVRKQEGLQTFLMKLASLEDIFPLESGYQDRATLVNLFFEGEFSQADNSASSFDNVVKGGYKFEPEELRMFDVMFSHKFTALKELEKQWIGYLNKEGSSSMKWSFIEYILVETGKKLHNERELRRINGKRVNPTLNVPGASMSASDGMREFIKKQITGLKLKPFDTIGEWDDTNVVDVIVNGTAMVPKWVRDTGMLKVYISSECKTAYNARLRSLNGSNMDYKGGIDYVLDYDNVKLIVVPNLAPSKRIVWTLEGNFSLFEDKPGEMYNFSLEQQDWSLKVWSQWRESFWAYRVGKKMATSADFPDDYSSQLIWCNSADLGTSTYIPIEKDDATPSVADHKSLVSVGNTATVTITDIDDAAIGDEIHLKAGTTTNGIAIAASGKFSLLTAAWNPIKGEEIWLQKRADGKFIELKRVSASSVAIAFAANATTPSVSGGDTFITDANTGATAITNLTSAVTTKVYTIYGAGSTYATTIANSGNFVLSAAMTLSAGKWIKLRQSATDSKFYEISRSA